MKKWRVMLTVEMGVETPDDWNEELARFHYEENDCVINLIRKLMEEVDAEPGVCNLCSRATVSLLHFEDEANGDDG